MMTKICYIILGMSQGQIYLIWCVEGGGGGVRGSEKERGRGDHI